MQDLSRNLVLIAYANYVMIENKATLDDLPLRENLRGKRPYGAPQDSVSVRLNVNENTHPIPEGVLADIAEELGKVLSSVNRYPDRDAEQLRADLAAYLGHNLRVQQVWAANGSNEILQQILQAFAGSGRSLLSFTPTYSMYPLLAECTDTVWVPVRRPEGYGLTAEFVHEQLARHKPDVAILCGPNNPTGTSLDLETVVAAYDAFDGVLIVDEAYQEFDTAHPSALSVLPGRARLAVSRTMSKAFAYAGVRLGYLAADPAFIDALQLVRLPYHLSALTQTAARTALRHASTMLATVGEICQQRDRLQVALTELGYVVYPSGANFLLVGGFVDAPSMFQELFERGILIRDVGIPGHLRMSVGTERETSELIRVLRDIHRGHRLKSSVRANTSAEEQYSQNR